MDFRIKLPKSKDIVTDISYNCILIIMNKLSKYVHFILYKEKSIVR